MTMKNNNSKPMGCSKSSSKKKLYSNTILPQETRKTSNRHLTLHLKQLKKEQQQQKKNTSKLVEGKKS